MPYSFPNERAACKAGGHCDYVEDLNRKTCLFRVDDDQGVLIFIYDEDATGKYIKNGVIAPDTFYGIASVQFVDVLGPKRPKFILIEHQGDHGTGTDEQIHWLLGWHDGAFRTVFRETAYLWIDGLGEKIVYRLNYRFVKGKNPRLELQSNYDLVAVTADPYDLHSQWRDWLFWNEKNFSFYDRRIQEENGNFATSYGNEFKFRQQLEKKRLEVLYLPPVPARHDLDNEFDKQLKKIDQE